MLITNREYEQILKAIDSLHDEMERGNEITGELKTSLEVAKSTFITKDQITKIAFLCITTGVAIGTLAVTFLAYAK